MPSCARPASWRARRQSPDRGPPEARGSNPRVGTRAGARHRRWRRRGGSACAGAPVPQARRGAGARRGELGTAADRPAPRAAVGRRDSRRTPRRAGDHAGGPGDPDGGRRRVRRVPHGAPAGPGHRACGRRDRTLRRRGRAGAGCRSPGRRPAGVRRRRRRRVGDGDGARPGQPAVRRGDARRGRAAAATRTAGAGGDLRAMLRRGADAGGAARPARAAGRRPRAAGRRCDHPRDGGRARAGGARGPHRSKRTGAALRPR